MATVLGLAMKLTADSSGMAAGLSEAEKQIKNLRKSTDGIVSLFDKFAESSDAAAEAQANAARDILLLTSAFKEGLIDAQGFAVALNEIEQSAKASAATFAEGAATTAKYATEEERVAKAIASLDQQLASGAISAETHARAMLDVTGANAQAAAALEASEEAERAHVAALKEGEAVAAKYATEEEKMAAAVAKLDQQLASGVISAETHARAIADVTGANARAKQAEDEHAAAVKRAAEITRAALTPQQVYDNEIIELQEHLRAGRISQETYNASVEKAARSYAKAEVAAAKFEAAGTEAATETKLKFNELSGVLAVIPGSIGNVAGRLSGLASAGEGLAKVFSSGLTAGLGNVGSVVAGLANPFTVGLAAVAAFGAGATSVASSLVALEDRVERLGNSADKLGVSFEFIQVLEESANRSGVSFEQVNSATTRLLKTLAGADEESKAATEALGRLGLSLDTLEGLSAEDQFRAIGAALTGIEDPAKRVAAATALFGKSGAELLPFFNNLGPAADDIERFGATLSGIDRKRIDDFGAGIDALGVATRALGQEVTLPFVQLGEGVALAAAEFIGGISQIASVIGDILAPEMDTLGNLFKALGAAAALAADVIAGAFRLVQQVLEPIGGSILPAVGAGIAFINRQILIGAVSNLAKFFTAAASAAVVYATGAGTASLATAALGVSIRTAINSTGIGVLVTGFGLAAGALLEWAFASDEATTSLGGVTSAASGAKDEAARLAEELAREDEQNFQGIQRAISQAQEALNAAAGDAERFGDAGFKAAADFQAAIRELQDQADRGILNETSLAQEVDKARQAYQRQIGTLEQLAKAEEDRAAAAKRAADAAIQADQRRADSFISSQQLGGEDPATKAAEDLLAITRQIDEAEAAIVAARAAGDAQAEQAALRRLSILDQAQAAASEVVEFGFSSGDIQRAIEEVRSSLDDTFSFDNFEIAPEAFAAAQEQLRELESQLEARVIDPDAFEEAANAIRKGFDDALKTANKIADLNERYAERVAEIDAERLDALSQVSQQPLQATDLRTSEGASQFLAMATGRQDPAIEEYRKQLGELKKIEGEIRKLGGVVDIVGAG